MITEGSLLVMSTRDGREGRALVGSLLGRSLILLKSVYVMRRTTMVTTFLLLLTYREGDLHTQWIHWGEKGY